MGEVLSISLLYHTMFGRLTLFVIESISGHGAFLRITSVHQNHPSPWFRTSKRD